MRAIAGRFEAGQPILVGHHSERRARKDKERIDNGMRKAVQFFDTAAYWKRRAAATLRHAAFKERIDVRARRIKTLEADRRKHERGIEDARAAERLWLKVPRFEWDDQTRIAGRIAGSSSGGDVHAMAAGGRVTSIYSLLRDGIHGDTAWRSAVASLAKTIERNERWLNHYTNRIAYERLLLEDAGGLPADKFDIQLGGRVLIGAEWFTVTRVNKKAGEICSVSVASRGVRVRGIEEVKGYEAPSADAQAAVQAVTKLATMCNYPGEGFLHMTNAEWMGTHKDYKGSRQLGQGAERKQPGSGRPDIRGAEAFEQTGLHRVRIVMRGGLHPVYVTDLKRKDPPAAASNPTPAPVVPPPAPDASAVARRVAPSADAPTEFDVMRDQLRAGGAHAVAAPQLFSTSDPLALRMVNEANVQLGSRLLEPQAGLGALLRALPGLLPFGEVRQSWAHVVAVEINAALAAALRARGLAHEVHCADFLQCTPQQLGRFDSILMNPPFANGADVKHIEHALTFLAPGGRLVGICANGPLQQEHLRPVAITSGGFYEPLPAGSFAHVGTNVSTALVVINA